MTRVAGSAASTSLQVRDRLAPVRAPDPHPVELGRGAGGERAGGVGGAVQGAVVVHHGDAVRGGVDVELQVGEPLVDSAAERGRRVLQPGELVEVPAAVGVGARVGAVEVRVQGGRAPGRSGHRHGPSVRVRRWSERRVRGGHGTIAVVTTRPGEAERLRDLARLRRVRDRIDREYAQPLDVEALARGAHMSAGHLSRAFRLAYGESPYAYLMTRRIERAMALLRRGDMSVTEVCFAVGCSSLGTFSTRFTELVGVPPSVYRRDAADEAAGIPPCVAKQVTRPIRNREARAREPHLA